MKVLTNNFEQQKILEQINKNEIVFLSYPSITNFKQSVLNKLLNGSLSENDMNTEFVITEKVHGSNFGFIFTPTVKTNNPLQHDYPFEFCACQSRNEILSTEKDTFFGGAWKGLLNMKYLTKLVSLVSRLVGEQTNNIHQVVLYGEFAGVLPNGSMVQKEVIYQDMTVYFFDLMILNKQGEVSFLDKKLLFTELAREEYTSRGIQSVPVLHYVTVQTEKLEDILLNNSFASLINPVEDNICEGIIFEPVIPVYHHGSKHFVYKNKNEIYTEKRNEKHKKVVKVDVKISDEEKQIFNVFLQYINQNRLSNVVSHYGFNDVKTLGANFGKLKTALFEDVKKDCLKDNPELSEKITPLIINLIQKECLNEVREFIQNFE